MKTGFHLAAKGSIVLPGRGDLRQRHTPEAWHTPEEAGRLNPAGAEAWARAPGRQGPSGVELPWPDTAPSRAPRRVPRSVRSIQTVRVRIKRQHGADSVRV